jgi:glycosyltransferase involved in cell wall biosynthesis
MRIAYFHYDFTPNPDYLALVNELRARGHVVWFGAKNASGALEWHDGANVVAYQRGPSPLPQVVQRVPFLRSVVEKIAYLTFILRVRRFLRQMRFDVVQTLPLAVLPLLLPLFMPRRMKFVFAVKQINFGVRSDWFGKLKEWMMLKSWQLCARYFYHHAVFDYPLAGAALLGEQWRRWGTAIPLGLNPRLLEVSRPSSNQGEEVRFIYVGSISRFRQLERLLEAVQHTRVINNNFKIDIIGPDFTDGYYHRLVDAMGISDVVHVKPPVPYAQIPDLMAAYDVGLAYNPDYLTWHCQPTIKVLEYRALGLPILSTDVQSHRDIVEEGVNGLLVQNDPAHFAEGLLRFVTDGDFLRACRLNAQKMRRAVLADEAARLHEEVYTRLGSFGEDAESKAIYVTK